MTLDEQLAQAGRLTSRGVAASWRARQIPGETRLRSSQAQWPARSKASNGNRFVVLRRRGHTKIESTVRYLGIEVDDALAKAEQVDV
jgi:hypothetical protein